MLRKITHNILQKRHEKGHYKKAPSQFLLHMFLSSSVITVSLFYLFEELTALERHCVKFVEYNLKLSHYNYVHNC